MSRLEYKAFAYLENFEEFAKQYTPDVADAALAVVQINGIKGVIAGIALTIIGSVAIYFANNFRKSYTPYNNHELGIIAFGICALMLLIPGLGYLLDVWNYVAIIEPKLALANKILGSK